MCMLVCSHYSFSFFFFDFTFLFGLIVCLFVSSGAFLEGRGGGGGVVDTNDRNL